jgi:malonyl CoA-acyl carrier protein transacylase
VKGPKEELDSTVISQPAIFVASMAALEKLRRDDPAALESCTVAMGLSLGTLSVPSTLLHDKYKLIASLLFR